MKFKMLSFLLGFLVGPLIVFAIGFMFFFGPFNESDTTLQASADFEVKATLDLSGFPKEKLPTRPWYAYVFVNPATNPWEIRTNFLPIFLGTLDGFPKPVSFRIGSQQALVFEDLLTSENSFKKEKDTHDVSFTFLIGDENLVKFMQGAENSNGSGSAFFHFRVEAMQTFSRDISAANGKTFDLGKLYVREYYSTTDLKGVPCPAPLAVTAEISDPTKSLAALMQGKDTYLMKVPDEVWQSSVVNTEKIVLNAKMGGDYAGLYKELAEVKAPPADGAPINLSFTYNEPQNHYSHFFLLFCTKGEPKASCFQSFAAGTLKMREFVSDKKYYQLVPAELAVARCDQRKLSYYFYPFKNSLTAPNHFVVKEQNPAVPAEVIEAR